MIMKTIELSIENEYVKRMIAAGNGLFEAFKNLRQGKAEAYTEYYKAITHQSSCPDYQIQYWISELQREAVKAEESPNSSLNKPIAMLNGGMYPWISMNVDHHKLHHGDIFMFDGNHRVTAALIRGEKPLVTFSDENLTHMPQWQAVFAAKSDPVHRVKHQPHPHPIIADLTSFRTMESCKARYDGVRDAGIKSAYEIGCAEGVGLWLLQNAGVNVKGSEMFGPSRTLAESLLKISVDETATPDRIPEVECIILFSVLYHLLADRANCDVWINRIKQLPCVALELSTNEENMTKPHYRHMSKYDPLSWWPNRKHIFTDPLHAYRETWLCWK
jgi:hypothetical protein